MTDANAEGLHAAMAEDLAEQLDLDAGLREIVGDDLMNAWWYLSFVDPDLAPPTAEQRSGGVSWLGACYVQARSGPMACTEAHRLGCNPGGEVVVVGPFTDDEMDRNVPEDQRNRLLTREDLR